MININNPTLTFRCYLSLCSDGYVTVTVENCGNMKENTLAARRKCKEVYFFRPKVCVLAD